MSEKIAIAWARSQMMILRMEEHFSKDEVRQFLEDNAMAATASFQNRVYMGTGFMGNDTHLEGWYVCGTFVPRLRRHMASFLRLRGDCGHLSTDKNGACNYCEAKIHEPLEILCKCKGPCNHTNICEGCGTEWYGGPLKRTKSCHKCPEKKDEV